MKPLHYTQLMNNKNLIFNCKIIIKIIVIYAWYPFNHLHQIS